MIHSKPKRLGDYVLVSPVRDEAATIMCTVASVLAQSKKPLRYIIVDDGSSDGTFQMLERAAREHDFIRIVKNKDRGYRQVGPGVVRAFQRGLQELEDIEWNFVGKLDGDVALPCWYYEKLLDAFDRDARLGIASGQCLAPRRGSFCLEPNAPYHTRGPCKMYRRACLEEIGGLQPTLGWDGLDGYQARMRGWKTSCMPELQLLHLTPTHGKEGRFAGAMKAGRGAYCQHYLPSYMLARVAWHCYRPSYIVRGIGLGLGYLLACAKREKRLHDPKFVRFIHKQQRQRLLQAIGFGRTSRVLI